ncbi:MAG TPA: diphthine--ammonia ligase [Candidatus Acidoferrales bacterium]|nr:diphthine--ammonia ligase [Candidatus Acidoferrales bacterium]
MRACLFSGGKDSTLAIQKMKDKGMPVELLLTLVSKNDYSFMFHKPNVLSTDLQAEAMGIRHVKVETDGGKETELRDLERMLIDNGVTELVTGAIASEYQKSRVDRICNAIGTKHISPLWGITPMEELNELAANYEVIITQVAADGFDESYLGGRIDDAMIDRLLDLHKRKRIHLLFEGGEAETFVLDAPLFKKRIVVDKAHKEWSGGSGRYLIDEAHLELK